jgi:GNAT superfamily N-acetyltransferase
MDIDGSKIITKPTKVFYLKMERPPSPFSIEVGNVVFDQLRKPINPDDYLINYKSVGLNWNWLDRLVMPKEELSTMINAEGVHIYTMTIQDEVAGFLELVHEGDYAELLYFGLFPKFIGKGLGKLFLNWSISKAWSFNPKWIQLNTCELDHPNALPTYLKLGFREYKTNLEQRKVLTD